ncbi:fumarylacetoacetate hydrolase family protein [Embleya sp. NPDC008237]|uniref:fumarylacetoacetate hydrolase family protein n=1 Tax=Embleya sp. NPDC008237 TaxID=3363978 RepID=UPI0036E50595
MRGKSLGTFCPLGPVLATPDELADPQALVLRTRVNGETVQNSSTAEMVFGIAELLSHCSRAFTLEPGDPVLTGTPWGRGAFMDPPRRLVPGDVLETEIEGIGVLVNPILSCGTCDLGRGGLRQVCRERRITGVHLPGAFAERVAVPRSALHPLPADMSWEAAAVVEPAANAVHAWRPADVAPGARVGVIGAGAIGLVCLPAARPEHAASIAVADRSSERRQMAATLGATTVGAELSGEFDVVFDAVGAGDTHEQSVRLPRPGGVAIWLGLADASAGFDATVLVRTEKRMLGSFAYTADEFAEAAELVSGWEPGWTASYPLESGAEIFTGLMRGGSHPVKPILRPWRRGRRRASATRPRILRPSSPIRSPSRETMAD